VIRDQGAKPPARGAAPARRTPKARLVCEGETTGKGTAAAAAVASAAETAETTAPETKERHKPEGEGIHEHEAAAKEHGEALVSSLSEGTDEEKDAHYVEDGAEPVENGGQARVIGERPATSREWAEGKWPRVEVPRKWDHSAFHL
jgi:hypothetical protein